MADPTKTKVTVDDVRRNLGDEWLLSTALRWLVISNTMDFLEADPDKCYDPDALDNMLSTVNDCMICGSVDLQGVIEDDLIEYGGQDTTDAKDMLCKLLADDIAADLETSLKTSDVVDYKAFAKDCDTALMTAQMLLNVFVDLSATDPKQLARAFYMTQDKKGRPCMLPIAPVDLLCPKNKTWDKTSSAVKTILKWLHESVKPEAST